MKTFRPSDPPQSFTREQRDWLRQVQNNIAGAASRNSTSYGFDVLHAEPSRITDGMVVYADGTDWDPGSGAGLYAYIDSAWVSLAGGAGGGTTYFTGYFPGTAYNVATGARLYPGVAGDITTLQAWASSNVAADTTIAVLKNGAAWASATILAGTSTITVTSFGSPAILATDYLTATLTSSGAQDVGFRGEIT